MPKNKPGAQTQSQAQAAASPPSPSSSASQKLKAGEQPAEARKGRQEQKPRIGGPAVPGAKSTLPRTATATDPQQQQYESMNREMRRRLRQMKAGPYSEAPSPAEKYRKKLEKQKRKKEQQKKAVERIAETAPRQIHLGRRLIYFVVAIVLVLVVVIVLAVLHHFGVF
ncbi:MAG: hypothetical protein IMW90_07955 [Thermogemmatispora sp.]|jgi:cobalamin biosynthesis Mg chelatase CobN|uniref:Uncharacterized protein n=1 Tax=Thermogemmatispora aurantia TaxID=2045279 RepID=A0A5J4KAV4_9CHLR|nr:MULTISPECIES: hypothetical protein [Thermogemmatispora]MBE3565650.1 hypothetical protein [Thermogemmatispora sp.]GER85704.1 hypothetical protein KTAU_43380 [Thermogemmatispora aurantia]